MGIDLEMLKSFSEINGRIGTLEEIYSTKKEFKNGLLYGGLLGAVRESRIFRTAMIAESKGFTLLFVLGVTTHLHMFL